MGEIRLLVNSLFNWFVYLDKQLLFSLLLTRKTRNGSSVRCISYKQWNDMSLPRRREEVRSSRKRKYSGTSELFLRFSPSLVPPMYLFYCKWILVTNICYQPDQSTHSVCSYWLTVSAGLSDMFEKEICRPEAADDAEASAEKTLWLKRWRKKMIIKIKSEN